MTTNLVQDAKTTDREAREARGLAIGETDAHVFNCPSCARPLSEGTSKCPGCGVRLIMGVRLRRAAAILGLGVALGILAGGLGTAAAITLSLHDTAAATVTPRASAAPTAAATRTIAPITVVDPAGPAAAASALSGTAVVNGRIAVDAETLTSTLARSNATTIEIARALRSLAADAALGIDLVGRLEAWPEAKPVRTGLDDFYQSMGDTARSGLRFSLTDEAAYRRSGVEMLKVLASLGQVDARSRAFAAANGLELSPVAVPSPKASSAP